MMFVNYYVLLLTILAIASNSQSEHSKVAVVTGANKGIGYEIVKGLCKRYHGHVYLTSRNKERGKKAYELLTLLGQNPHYHQLDVTDPMSIRRFRDYINETEGGIDILINNAAVANFFDHVTPYERQVENVMKTNYFGLLQVSEALFPLLRPNARVINLSSTIGTLSHISARTLRAKLASRSLNIDLLNTLMNKYIRLAKQGKHSQKGWPADHDSPYVVSKIGVSALTFIQQRILDAESEKRNISVNCVSPGYVSTDLTRHTGNFTVEQGAFAPLHLALEKHSFHGNFVLNDLRVLDWYHQ